MLPYFLCLLMVLLLIFHIEGIPEKIDNSRLRYLKIPLKLCLFVCFGLIIAIYSGLVFDQEQNKKSATNWFNIGHIYSYPLEMTEIASNDPPKSKVGLKYKNGSITRDYIFLVDRSGSTKINDLSKFDSLLKSMKDNLVGISNYVPAPNTLTDLLLMSCYKTVHESVMQDSCTAEVSCAVYLGQDHAGKEQFVIGAEPLRLSSKNASLDTVYKRISKQLEACGEINNATFRTSYSYMIKHGVKMIDSLHKQETERINEKILTIIGDFEDEADTKKLKFVLYDLSIRNLKQVNILVTPSKSRKEHVKDNTIKQFHINLTNLPLNVVDVEEIADIESVTSESFLFEAVRSATALLITQDTEAIPFYKPFFNKVSHNVYKTAVEIKDHKPGREYILNFSSKTGSEDDFIEVSRNNVTISKLYLNRPRKVDLSAPVELSLYTTDEIKDLYIEVTPKDSPFRNRFPIVLNTKMPLAVAMGLVISSSFIFDIICVFLFYVTILMLRYKPDGAPEKPFLLTNRLIAAASLILLSIIFISLKTLQFESLRTSINSLYVLLSCWGSLFFLVLFIEYKLPAI